MQPGEGQLLLRLDAGGAKHSAAGCAPGQVLEQGGLAHARLAVHHEGVTLARVSYRLDQAVEERALGLAARQSHGVIVERR
jgi:hypothetical protein